MMPVVCLRSWFCLGAGMVYANWLCQGTNPGKLARCPPNVAQFNPGKIDAFAWVEFWRTH